MPLDLTVIPPPDFSGNTTCPSGSDGTPVVCNIKNHTTDRETVCISYKNHDCYWIWYPKPFSFNYGYFPPINRQCCGLYDFESPPQNVALLEAGLVSNCQGCSVPCDTCLTGSCAEPVSGEDDLTQCNAKGEGAVSIGPGMHDYDQTITAEDKLGGNYNAIFPPSTQEENEAYAVASCPSKYDRSNAGLTTYQKRVARDYFPWAWEIHQFANMRPIRPFIGGPFEVDFLTSNLSQNQAAHIYQPRKGGTESILQPYYTDISNSYYPIDGPYPESLKGGHPLFRYFTTVMNVEYSYQTVNNLRAIPLVPGDIAIVGYQSNGAPLDSISFVALVDLLQGNRLLFTNSGWSTESFEGQWGTEPGRFHGVTDTSVLGSGQLMYFENSAFIPAGTIISSTDTENPKYKWTTSGPINAGQPDLEQYTPLDLGNTGDQVTVGQNFYITEQGGPEYINRPLKTYESPSHGYQNQRGFVSLYNFDNTGQYESAIDTHTGALPPELIRGFSAVRLNNNFTSYVFDITSLISGTKEDWLDKIGNATNWIGSDATDDLASGLTLTVLPSPGIDGIYAQEVPQGDEHTRLTGLTNDWIWSRIVPKKFILKSDGVPAFSFHSFYWSSEVRDTCLEIVPSTAASAPAPPKNFSECVHNTDSSEDTVVYHNCVQDVLYSALNAEQLSCRDWRKEIYDDLVLCNKWALKRKELYPNDETKWWADMELLFDKYKTIDKLKPVGPFRIAGDSYWLREVGLDGELTITRPPALHNVAPGPAGVLPILYTNSVSKRTLQVDPQIYDLQIPSIVEHDLIYNIRPAEDSCCEAGGAGCEGQTICCPPGLCYLNGVEIAGTIIEGVPIPATDLNCDGITAFAPDGGITHGIWVYGAGLGCTYDATNLNRDNAVLRAYRRLTRSVYFRSFPSAESNWSWIGHGEEASAASKPEKMAKYRWLSNRILGTYQDDVGSDVAHSAIRWSHISGGGPADKDFSWCVSGVPGGPQSGEPIDTPVACTTMCIGAVCDTFIGHASYTGNPHVLIGRYDSNHRNSYIPATYGGFKHPLDTDNTCEPGSPDTKQSENCYHMICKPQYNNYCWLRHNRRNTYWSHSFTCACDGIKVIDGLTYECAVLFNEVTQQYGSGTTGFCCREGESLLFCDSDISTRKCTDGSTWIRGTHETVPAAIPYDLRPQNPRTLHPTDDFPYCVPTPRVHSFQKWCNNNDCDTSAPPNELSLTPHSSCYKHPQDELGCSSEINNCNCASFFQVGYGCGEDTYGSLSRHIYATGLPWSYPYGTLSNNKSQFIDRIMGQYEVCDSTFNQKVSGIEHGNCFWGSDRCKKIIPPNKDAKCKTIFGLTGACCVDGTCYNMTEFACAATGGVSGGDFISYRVKCEDIQNDCSLLCELRRPLFIDTLTCPGLSC